MWEYFIYFHLFYLHYILNNELRYFITTKIIKKNIEFFFLTLYLQRRFCQVCQPNIKLISGVKIVKIGPKKVMIF